MFASRPCRLALTVTCRQILAPHNAGSLEQAENGQMRTLLDHNALPPISAGVLEGPPP